MEQVATAYSLKDFYFEKNDNSEGKQENNKGNDIQIILGKDLFIKDFDKQLIGSKVNQTINVSVNLPQNFQIDKSMVC